MMELDAESGAEVELLPQISQLPQLYQLQRVVVLDLSANTLLKSAHQESSEEPECRRNHPRNPHATQRQTLSRRHRWRGVAPHLRGDGVGARSEITSAPDS